MSSNSHSSNANRVNSQRLISIDFFQNIGMLKVDFNIHPSNIPINNFFYSVYGNNGFTLKGAFDISSLRNRETVPSLFFKTGANNVYFLKVKFVFNGEEKEQCRFFDLTRNQKRENINMNILDKSVEELFRSINLEEDEQSDDSNDDALINEQDNGEYNNGQDNHQDNHQDNNGQDEYRNNLVSNTSPIPSSIEPDIVTDNEAED